MSRATTSSPELARWRWWYVLPTLCWVPMLVRGIRGTSHNDFDIFWQAALCLRDGLPLYESGYMYPPFMAWLLVPLTVLSQNVAGALWAFGKVPVFYGAVCAFLPEGLGTRACRNLFVLSPLLVFRFLESDIANGNSNVYLLGGIALSYHLCGRGRQKLAGSVTAAVVAVKLSPLYLAAPYFMAGKRHCAITIPTMAALLVVGSSLPIEGGLRAAWGGFTGTSSAVFDVPKSDATDPHRGYLPGQSVRPILHRWLRDSDATAHDGERVTINVVDLDAEAVEWLYRGLALVMAALGVIVMRKRGLPWSLAWGLIVLLLIAPYSRKAHFLWLLPSVLFVLGHLARNRSGRRLVVIAFSMYFLSGHMTARHIVGREWSYLLNGAGATFLATVAILFAMWIIRPPESSSTTRYDTSSQRED